MAVEVPVKKASHQANIIKIENVLPHPDPETTNLELIHIGGYQVVSRKGTFKPHDLAVYIQPDSVVPQSEPFRFIWEPYVQPGDNSDNNASAPATIVSDRHRRITVRRFRGEWSEGLLLPLSDFPDLLVTGEGQDVSSQLGITHYDPDAGTESTGGSSQHAPRLKSKWPRSLKGWFFFIWNKITRNKLAGSSQNVSFVLPVYDVDALKNYGSVFQPGDPVIITEKIHGSNARYLFLDGVMYAGSRQLWKSPDSNCVWRKGLKDNPWIEKWCREHPGYALYGEVTPTQKGFDYGSGKKVRFFLFDVRTPDGKWMPEDAYYDFGLSSNDITAVPELYVGPFDLSMVRSLVDGTSKVPGAKHIREGVVIKSQEERQVRGLGRAQLKIVSNAFLAKDSK